MYAEGTNLVAGLIVAVLLFMLTGWVVNKIAKRPLMNSAAWLSGYLLIAFALSVVVILRSPVDQAYEIGRHVGLYLVPATIAMLYARRWRKKRPGAPAQPNVS
jgi:predicted PurR-regulated permease PerM